MSIDSQRRSFVSRKYKWTGGRRIRDKVANGITFATVFSIILAAFTVMAEHPREGAKFVSCLSELYNESVTTTSVGSVVRSTTINDQRIANYKE
jgi:hypothetical protein